MNQTHAAGVSMGEAARLTGLPVETLRYYDRGWLARLDAVRDLLTVGGRTLVQGALGSLWALDPALVPLPAETAAQISVLLTDSPERR